MSRRYYYQDDYEVGSAAAPRPPTMGDREREWWLGASATPTSVPGGGLAKQPPVKQTKPAFFVACAFFLAKERRGASNATFLSDKLNDLFGRDTSQIRQIQNILVTPELQAYIDALRQWVDDPKNKGPQYVLPPTAATASRTTAVAAPPALIVKSTPLEGLIDLTSNTSAARFVDGVRAVLPPGITLHAEVFRQSKPDLEFKAAKGGVPAKEVTVELREDEWKIGKEKWNSGVATVTLVGRAVLDALLGDRSAPRPDPANVTKYGYHPAAHRVEGTLPSRDVQWDKKKTIIIHGETGIGKTAYATQSPDIVGVDDSAVYHLLNIPDEPPTPGPKTAASEASPAITAQSDKAAIDAIEAAEQRETSRFTAALMDIFVELERIGRYDEPGAELARAWLERYKARTFQTRNRLAVTFVTNLVKTKLAIAPEWQGRNTQSIPSLVVVIDEISKCLALARGIAAAQTEIYEQLEPYSKLVTLVLVGTGADGLAFGSDTRPTTDPSKVALIRVKAPDRKGGMTFLHHVVSRSGSLFKVRIEALKSCADDVLKWMVTNPRLVIGLGRRLDITIPAHRVPDRLPGLIVDALEEFATLNGIGGLKPDTRQQLMSNAYFTLMQPVGEGTGLLPLPEANAAACEQSARFGILERERDAQGRPIMSKYRASEAMKLVIVSDFGRQLAISDGFGFEALVKAMLCRHWSALGFAVQQLKLCFPLPGTGGTFGMTRKNFEAIVTGLTHGNSAKHAVVIENGLDAPGADFIVLCRNPAEATTPLECFFLSCKNKREGHDYAATFDTLGLAAGVRMSGNGIESGTIATTIKPSQQVAFGFQSLLREIHLMNAAATTAMSAGAMKRIRKKFRSMPTARPEPFDHTTVDSATHARSTKKVPVANRFYVLESRLAPTEWANNKGETPEGDAFAVVFGEELRLWRSFIDYDAPVAEYFL